MKKEMKTHCLKSIHGLKQKLSKAVSVRTLLFVAFFQFVALGMYAQSQKISLNLDNVSVEDALKAIEKQSGYSFVYNSKQINVDRKVSVHAKDKTVENILGEIFQDEQVTFDVDQNNHIILNRAATQQKGNQNGKSIRGVVKDQSGETVIGANVTLQGHTAVGTVTDIDGQFSLKVPADRGTLLVSYIGYLPAEISIANKQDFIITLREDSKILDEVVVVGYGSQKKANLTGSVSSVKMDEVIGNRPILNAADALQGTVPGLIVSNGGNDPGKSKSFQIRGAYSLGVKNDNGSYGKVIAPLMLIDNVEGDIDMINPEDIETMTVLKDAASAAIYGARAAGGVILITTKRPKGGTTFQLNYNNNFGFGRAMNLPKQAPLTEYLQAYSDAAGDQFWTKGTPSVSKWMQYLGEYRKDPSAFNTVGDGIYKDSDGGIYYLNEKDLVDNFLTNSFQMTHNISATGGTEKIRYRLSGGYISNDGILITDKDNYERLNINAFISADVTKWFTQEATLSYAHGQKTLPTSALGAIYSTRLASFYPEGDIPASISGASKDLPAFTPRNQILWSNAAKTMTDNPRIFLKSILKPFKGFEAAFEYTFDKNIYDYHWYTGKTEYTTVQGGSSTTPVNDYLRKDKRYTDYNAFNIYGTYDFALGKHRFKVMAGFNQESSYLEELDAYSYGQAVTEVPGMASGTSTIKVTDRYTEYSVRGGFFRVNYNYKDKYLLEVNGRYDGSSKFPKNSRYGFFPSVSAGWQIAQEKFMESTQNWLDGLKLRASYGMIGNQNVAPYSFTPTMSINNKDNTWLVNNTYVTAISSIPALVSRSFTWEKVGTLDVGVDLTLLQNRLNATFDWYQRDTRGMLAPGMQLPAVVGASAPYQNTADMRTKGWELSFNWRDKIGQVGYRAGFNLSDYQSEISKYDDNASKILTSQMKNPKDGANYTFWNFYEGKQVGEIWGHVADGYYSVDDFESTTSWKLKEGVPSIDGTNPRPGDIKFKNLMDDENGNNLISNGENTIENPGDRKVIGNTTPRYMYGITLGANYAGFDINIFMQGTGQRDAWIANTLTFPLYSDFKFIPLYEGLGDYWKPTDANNGDYTAINPNAKYPRIYGNYGNQGSNYRQSDKYLSDASFFRIKNVTLSYTVPKRWISKLTLSQLKGFVSIENLATFSSLPSGIDPETLDWDYPSYRTISFGINLTL